MPWRQQNADDSCETDFSGDQPPHLANLGTWRGRWWTQGRRPTLSTPHTAWCLELMPTPATQPRVRVVHFRQGAAATSTGVEFLMIRSYPSGLQNIVSLVLVSPCRPADELSKPRAPCVAAMTTHDRLTMATTSRTPHSSSSRRATFQKQVRARRSCCWSMLPFDMLCSGGKGRLWPSVGRQRAAFHAVGERSPSGCDGRGARDCHRCRRCGGAVQRVLCSHQPPLRDAVPIVRPHRVRAAAPAPLLMFKSCAGQVAVCHVW